MIWAYMKHKFRDIPLIDHKGKKFRPASEKCLNDVYQDLAAKCFVKVARVIEEYCNFHEIVPEERIEWLQPSGRPVVEDIRVALSDLSPPAPDSMVSALDSVGLTLVVGAWGTNSSSSSSSESTVTLVRQAPEVCVLPQPPASRKTTSKSSKKHPVVNEHARQLFVRAGMIIGIVEEEPLKSHSPSLSDNSGGLYYKLIVSLNSYVFRWKTMYTSWMSWKILGADTRSFIW